MHAPSGKGHSLRQTEVKQKLLINQHQITFVKNTMFIDFKLFALKMKLLGKTKFKEHNIVRSRPLNYQYIAVCPPTSRDNHANSQKSKIISSGPTRGFVELGSNFHVPGEYKKQV